MNLSTGEVCLSSNHLQRLDPFIVGTKPSTHKPFWDPSYTDLQPAPPIQGWWVLLVPKRVVQGGYPVYFWGSHQVWWLRGDDLLSSFWACIWLAALFCLPFLKTAPTEDILPPKSTTHFREAVYHDGVVDVGKIVPPGPPCHFWKVSLASEPSAQWAEAFAESKVQFLPSG